jgi:FkbM family methyltransferase
MGARCVGAEGNVVAIEASPVTFDKLTHNIALNRNKNIRPINMAAWNMFAELRLFRGTDNDSGKNTVAPEFDNLQNMAKHAATDIVTKAAPLSGLLLPKEIATAALIKIDVEGAEQQVIEGLAPVFQHLPQDVRFVTELNPGPNRTTEDFLRFFADRGFKAYVIKNEYDSDFYLDARQQRPVKPAALLEEITKQTDLIFSRLPL